MDTNPYAPEKLTDKIVRDLPAPAKGNKIKYDTEVAGFGARITAAGAVAFILNYRVKKGPKAGTERRHTIGDQTDWSTVTAARNEAKRLKRLVDQGGDPVGEAKADREAPTMTALCDRYLEQHVEPHNKPRTVMENRRIVERIIKPKLGRLKVEAVDHDDVAKLHRDMKATPRRANHVLAVLSKMFNLAEKWNRDGGKEKLRPLNSNPCKHIQRYPENERDRFLDADELERAGKALREMETECKVKPEIAACIRFLVFTGFRLSEAVEATWDKVNAKAGTFRLPDTKNGKPRYVPLGAPALLLLASLPHNGERVFGSITNAMVEKAWSGEKPRPARRQKGKPGIRDRAGIPDVRVHDLRHTTGTYAGSAGYNAFLVRDLLGHKTLAMTGRYVSKHVDPLRAAADAVSGQIAAALNGPTGEVVEMPKAQER
jgi:integrase